MRDTNRTRRRRAFRPTVDCLDPLTLLSSLGGYGVAYADVAAGQSAETAQAADALAGVLATHVPAVINREATDRIVLYQPPDRAPGFRDLTGAVITAKDSTWAGSKPRAYELARIGIRNGLRITCEKCHSQTANGNLSDHSPRATHSYAYDLAGSRTAMSRTARQIAEQLGVRNYNGGYILNVRRDGFRYQLIWNCGGSACGGNHYDHVHIGVRNLRYPNG